MENTTNYSCNKITSTKKTWSYLLRSDSSTSQQESFYFGVYKDPKQVMYRAKTYAINQKSHGAFNFSKIFKINDNKVVDFLTELSVYSEVKSYHNALFDDKLNRESDLGYCFKGHSESYYLMKTSDHMIIRNGVAVSMNIELGTYSERCVKFSILVKSFPFLSSYSETISSYGLTPFYIPKYEEAFAFIQEDYYSKRALGEPVKIEPDLISESNGLTDKVSGLLNSKGVVEIVKMRNNSSQQIIQDGIIPLTNAFMNKHRTKLYFLEVNGNFEIKDNRSFFFNMANGIYIKDKTDIVHLVDKYYKTMPITLEEDFFVTSEVFTNTGIRCAYMLRKDTKSIKIGDFNPKDLLDLVLSEQELPNSIEEAINLINKLIEKVNDSKEGGKTKPKGK